jgi:hypothetical protein
MISKRCNGGLITHIINISSLLQQGPRQGWPLLDLEPQLTICEWTTELQLLEVPLTVEILDLITCVERSRHWRKTTHSFPPAYNATATYPQPHSVSFRLSFMDLSTDTLSHISNLPGPVIYIICCELSGFTMSYFS